MVFKFPIPPSGMLMIFDFVPNATMENPCHDPNVLALVQAVMSDLLSTQLRRIPSLLNLHFRMVFDRSGKYSGLFAFFPFLFLVCFRGPSCFVSPPLVKANPEANFG